MPIVPVQEVGRSGKGHATGMAGDDAGGKQARFVGGPRSVGSLLPAITRTAFRSRAAGGAQLLLDWPTIVGPALARASTPRSLARGTLVLACSGPVALELQHLSAQLMERINGHYGRALVQTLRFVQATAPTGLAAPPPPRPPAEPVEVPDMPPGPLRDALAALGGAVRLDSAAPSSNGAAPFSNGAAPFSNGADRRRLTRSRGSEA